MNRAKYISAFLVLSAGTAIAAPPTLTQTRAYENAVYLSRMLSVPFYRDLDAYAEPRYSAFDNTDPSPGQVAWYQINYYRNLNRECKRHPETWQSCHNIKKHLAEKLSEPFGQNTLAFYNKDGTCFGWNILHRKLLSRARFRPELDIPADMDEKHVDRMIRAMREGEIVEIPGFSSIHAFTEKYEKIARSHAKGEWTRQVSPATVVLFLESSIFQSRLDALREIREIFRAGERPQISVKMVEGRHSLMVNDIQERPDRSWDLEVIDSNYPSVPAVIRLNAEGKAINTAVENAMLTAKPYRRADFNANYKWKVAFRITDIAYTTHYEETERDDVALTAECCYRELKELGLDQPPPPLSR
ncbi:MAG: hypothetical protein AB7F66_16570 [Bacteriovoracia bacterium]